MITAGIVIDESAKYDGYNWSDVYFEDFKALGDNPVLLDFKADDWLQQVEIVNPDLILWRAWHRPDDRDDAKDKIHFLENFLQISMYPNNQMYVPYDNKRLQAYMLANQGIPIPRTYIFRNQARAMEFTQNCDLPLISKVSEGACGGNVKLYQCRKDLQNHIEACFSDEGVETQFPWIKQKGYVYLQEYLPGKRDLRIITIGDSVELAFWRENESSWKKNINQGATINPNGIPKEAKNLALEVSKKFGFHWNALDMIETGGKFYILEFSSIFGFSSAEDYTRHFGSVDGGVLFKQVKYLHDLHS